MLVAEEYLSRKIFAVVRITLRLLHCSTRTDMKLPNDRRISEYPIAF